MVNISEISLLTRKYVLQLLNWMKPAAITVSVAARSVGALMVSSLMVIPVACAMQLANSYKKTVIYSVLFALLFTIVGLFLSYYMNLKPGGTIVLTGVVVLIPLMFVKRK